MFQERRWSRFIKFSWKTLKVYFVPRSASSAFDKRTAPLQITVISIFVQSNSLGSLKFTQHCTFTIMRKRSPHHYKSTDAPLCRLQTRRAREGKQQKAITNQQGEVKKQNFILLFEPLTSVVDNDAPDWPKVVVRGKLQRAKGKTHSGQNYWV